MNCKIGQWGRVDGEEESDDNKGKMSITILGEWRANCGTCCVILGDSNDSPPTEAGDARVPADLRDESADGRRVITSAGTVDRLPGGHPKIVLTSLLTPSSPPPPPWPLLFTLCSLGCHRLPRDLRAKVSRQLCRVRRRAQVDPLFWLARSCIVLPNVSLCIPASGGIVAEALAPHRKHSAATAGTIRSCCREAESRRWGVSRSHHLDRDIIIVVLLTTWRRGPSPVGIVRETRGRMVGIPATKTWPSSDPSPLPSDPMRAIHFPCAGLLTQLRTAPASAVGL